ncbi:signal peptidase II [Candidatus Woesearchaeota archaeon]|nr:signal peptidase II [Candidatus Woesearchaeota archaeon]
MVKTRKPEPDLLLTTIAVLAFDRLTKHYAQNLTEPISITPLLSISLVRNTGAAFGILPGTSLILAAIGTAVIAAILLSYRKLSATRKTRIATGLILAGTTGNLIDRLLLGYVIDFIDPSFWPAFNVADAALTVGAAILLIHIYTKKN